MRQLLTIALALLVSSATFQPLQAQYTSSGYRPSSNGVISPLAANRYGLKRAWFTQVQLDRSQSRFAHLTQHVSQSRFFTVFEVKYSGGSEYFDERMIDRFGEPLGMEEAKKLADERLKVLNRSGLETEIITLEIPEVTLYAMTDRATLHAIDAQTGKSKWVSSVGNRDHLSLAVGANDKYVAAVNGSYVHILDQATGEPIWSRQATTAIGAGAALTDDRVFVPLVNGKMEAYQLENPRAPAWYHQGTGRLFVQPTVNTNSVSWATDRGYLYVGQKEKAGVRFRLEARDAIVARSTYLPPNRLFAASIDGNVYAVHEFNGEVLWRFSAGDPISHPPVVTRDGLYAIADGAGIYRLDLDDGFEEWFAKGVAKFIAAGKQRVYCLDGVGRMIILDAKTGGRVATMPVENLDFVHANWQSDRLFVGTTKGVLQCLHEPDLKFPLIHIQPDPEASVRPVVVQKKDGEEEPADEPVAKEPADPFAAGGDDPFAAGGDPFGGDAGGGADPFGSGDAGGGADPFGGGDAGGDDDAGGGADPFGGGDAGGGEDPFG